MAGVLLFQSGPFMTVTVPGADPSGTGFPLLIGNGRADLVSGVSLYADNRTAQRWLNPAAFAVPKSNIGRYPTAPVGNIVGPGTQAVSMSLMKSVRIKESLRFRIGAQAANLFNHVNYAPIEQCSCAHGAMCTKTHGKGTARVPGLSPRGRLAATLCFRRSSPKGRSRLALRTLE